MVVRSSIIGLLKCCPADQCCASETDGMWELLATNGCIWVVHSLIWNLQLLECHAMFMPKPPRHPYPKHQSLRLTKGDDVLDWTIFCDVLQSLDPDLCGSSSFEFLVWVWVCTG